ncbi:MAG TPA: head-tail adaptor protein [Rickettsia endosymbiont of Columbicola hoogstraali]|nr:head-tail adaptor protein [Rickettsia endosymbiont of Columbicola hoogstraali]
MQKTVIRNFRHQIKFLENITLEPIEEDRWIEKLTVYAEIIPLCDNKFLALENISFGHVITEGYFLFKIRFIKNITTKMRIIFKEREFEIKRVINVEEKGITAEMDLNNAVVKIILYNNGVFEHFITYYCTLYTKYDLNFKMHLKPETIKYNQTIINRYSKTCRVSFRDNKCTIDKNLYSGVYKIKEILKESLRIENLDQENGYYNGSQIIFCDNNFSSKVLSSFGDLFILEDVMP